MFLYIIRLYKKQFLKLIALKLLKYEYFNSLIIFSVDKIHKTFINRQCQMALRPYKEPYYVTTKQLYSAASP